MPTNRQTNKENVICSAIQKNEIRVGEMAQMVQCLIHGHEDISLIPRTHTTHTVVLPALGRLKTGGSSELFSQRT